MAVNAEQLPSGSWRCRVYDPVTKKYKSFTTKVKGKRGKQLIEAEANAWAASHKPKPIQEKPFGECIDDYIELKSNILSPTTLDKYRNIRINQLSEDFLAVRMDDLDGVTIQTEINRLAAIYAPKTVINAHGLISATISAINFRTAGDEGSNEDAPYPSDILPFWVFSRFFSSRRV